ncbi:hypothetical protein DFH28DRAFT_922061 [Melampsora americana]|nr:hypothetical protein DFH28DRAFT_922061 [Melampsora americana]
MPSASIPSSGPATRSRSSQIYLRSEHTSSSSLPTSPSPCPTGIVQSVEYLAIDKTDDDESTASPTIEQGDLSEDRLDNHEGDISTNSSVVPPRFCDVTSKRSCLLYNSKVSSDRAEHHLNFNDFSDEINFSTELVMYTIGKQFVAVGSRDSEWVFRDINFEKDTVPPTRPLQSKYHELWNRTEVLGRLQATQSCEHNLYVSKMLGLFKAELKALWYNSRGS